MDVTGTVRKMERVKNLEIAARRTGTLLKLPVVLVEVERMLKLVVLLLLQKTMVVMHVRMYLVGEMLTMMIVVGMSSMTRIVIIMAGARKELMAFTQWKHAVLVAEVLISFLFHRQFQVNSKVRAQLKH
jgi:hypothetical protein